MELNLYFKSVIDQEKAPIVICDLNNIIIYMNPAAIDLYAKNGSTNFIGKNLLDCHNPNSAFKIIEVLHWFNESKDNNIIHTFYDEKNQNDGYMVALRDNCGTLIGYYEKHEYRGKDDAPIYAFN